MTLLEYIEKNDITTKMTMRDFFQISLGWEGLDRPYTRRERMEAYKEAKERKQLDILRRMYKGMHEIKERATYDSKEAAARLDKIIDRDEKRWFNY